MMKFIFTLFLIGSIIALLNPSGEWLTGFSIMCLPLLAISPIFDAK